MASLERSIWRWEEAFRGDDNRFKFLKDWVCKTSKVGHMCLSRLKASLVAQTHKKSACEAGDLGSVPGQEDPLEKEMAIHSSIIAWKIPWMEEPGRLQCMGLQSWTQLSN